MHLCFRVWQNIHLPFPTQFYNFRSITTKIGGKLKGGKLKENALKKIGKDLLIFWKKLCNVWDGIN